MQKKKIKASRVHALLVYDSGSKTPPGSHKNVKQLQPNLKGKALGQSLLTDALSFMKRLIAALNKNRTVNTELIKLGFQLVLEIVKELVGKWLR